MIYRIERDEDENESDRKKERNFPKNYPILSASSASKPVPMRESSQEPITRKTMGAPVKEPIKNSKIRVLNLQA